jgi:hypothetical protein
MYIIIDEITYYVIKKKQTVDQQTFEALVALSKNQVENGDWGLGTGDWRMENGE